jgi:hypothetical protein
VDGLLEHPSFSTCGFVIAVITRNPRSPAARALKDKSSAVRTVRGDYKDPAAIFASLRTKLWAIYIMTIPGKSEVSDGTRMIDAAIKAGVSHIVLSTVDRGVANGGNCPSFVSHWQNKHEIELHLRHVVADNSITYTILRPVFFMDNLSSQFCGKLSGTLWKNCLSHRSLKVVDSKDIGIFTAASIFDSTSSAWKNVETSVIGDDLTFSRANAIFRRQMGHDIPTTWKWITSLAVMLSKDFKIITILMQQQGNGGETGAPRGGIKPTNFKSWVSRGAGAFSEVENSVYVSTH